LDIAEGPKGVNSDIAVSFDYLADAAKERNWECVAAVFSLA